MARQDPPTRVRRQYQPVLLLVAGVLAVLVLIVLLIHNAGSPGGPSANANVGGEATPNAMQQELLGAGVDLGAPLHGVPAPDFTLTDQFNQPISLRQFRGKVVVVAFTDSQCTTICPLTTETMLHALSYLPASAAANVQLLGIDANPQATSVDDVRQYSLGHGLENRWFFLTGSTNQLQQVWHDYNIAVQINQGQIDHTPALYVIDPNGAEQIVYMTVGQYGVVNLEAYQLAAQIAALLPGHIHVSSQLPPIQILDSTQNIALPAMTAQGPSGTVTLGPGNKPLLTFFFASWAPNIQQELVELNQVARAPNAPRVVAIDVGSTEPSAAALQSLMGSLSQPLAYSVAYDQTGEAADAYHTQDIPWFTLADAQGNIIGSADGWVAPAQLMQTLQATPAATPNG